MSYISVVTFSVRKITDEGYYKEPVLVDNEPQWLMVTHELVSTSSLGQPILEIIKENKPLVPSPVFDLKLPGLWQCGKCGAIIPLNDHKHCTECDRESFFKPVTEMIMTDLWELPKWEDLPDLDMKQVYNDIYDLTKKLVIFQSDIEVKIFVLWLISTWKNGVWDVVGFPVFVGLRNSGKTTALMLLYHLCHRAVETSGITFKALPRLTHYYNVTLLIDEAHNKLRTDTEAGAGLTDFVKASYKKGSKYVTCDVDDQKGLVVIRNFGAKAFAAEKTFDPAILDRALVFWMDKGEPEIPKLAYVEDQLNQTKTKLLNYRYKTDNPPDLGKNFILKGRTREIYESIISTGMHIQIDTQDIIDHATQREKLIEQELQESIECQILRIIKEHEEKPIEEWDSNIENIPLSEIIKKLEWNEDDPKEKKKNYQRLGYILKNMGLQTRRTTEGQRTLQTTTTENETRLKRLYKRYKLTTGEK